MLAGPDEAVLGEVSYHVIPHHLLHHLAQHTGQGHWAVVGSISLLPLLEDGAHQGILPDLWHIYFFHKFGKDDCQWSRRQESYYKID